MAWTSGWSWFTCVPALVQMPGVADVGVWRPAYVVATKGSIPTSPKSLCHVHKLRRLDRSPQVDRPRSRARRSAISSLATLATSGHPPVFHSRPCRPGQKIFPPPAEHQAQRGKPRGRRIAGRRCPTPSCSPCPLPTLCLRRTSMLRFGSDPSLPLFPCVVR